MISVSFTGDIAFSGLFKGMQNKKDIISKEVLTFLNNSDYVVANIECPIINKKNESSKVLKHFMDKDSIYTLKKINANIWNLGNNHILDCGTEGLKSTLEVAKKENIRTIGVGVNKKEAEEVTIIKNDNITIGIISIIKQWNNLRATENSPGCIWLTDIKCIQQQIKKLKNKVDYIVAIIHAGDEFAHMPMPYDRKRYLKILDLGVDIIVAHHPHVVQNYEKIGKKIIFYSLGNFVFDTEYQRIQNYTDIGILLNIKFSKENYEWNYLPININRDNQTVEKGECPAIFTNITEKQYKMLWPLATKVFLYSDKKAQEYKDKFLTINNVSKKRNILRRIKGKLCKLINKRQLTLRLGKVFYYLYIWKLSKKTDVCNYMLNKY